MGHILLQTTIPATADDWGIERFSLLHKYLSSLMEDHGITVTARNREVNAEGNDSVLSTLGTSMFDQVWLFAVDVGTGLSAADRAGIAAFQARGGGLLTTRDHMDLGCSLCELPRVGPAHFFNSYNPDPDPTRHSIDDPYTTEISWPNYHSGKNGDYQRITPVEPIHPLLLTSSGVIQYFPAHPHEGAVGIPVGETSAQVIATGVSQVTGRIFNLAVAFEAINGQPGGRAVAQSTFHHFCDYNWDARSGCPSFVSELPGDTMQTQPQALADTHAYIKNLALWLGRVA